MTELIVEVMKNGERLDRVIALLEAIDAKLAKADEETARCGHGDTGLCMSCVIGNDLLRPRAR